MTGFFYWTGVVVWSIIAIVIVYTLWIVYGPEKEID